MATLVALTPTADAGWLRVFAPADSDGDGIPDKHDRCLAIAETVNGYADDDGCPDHLAVLDVLPRIGSTWVRAEVELTRASGTTQANGVPRVADDLVPGEVVQVEARALCYTAQGQVVVGQGRNELRLELTPRYDERIDWSLTDVDGAPLVDATIQFDSPCAPQQAITLAHGHGSVRVGEGEHRVRIEAPGYEPEVRVVRAGAGPVVVSLAPMPSDPADAVAEIVDEPEDDTFVEPGGV